MSIWTQFSQLVSRFFPNRVAQVFFYAGLVIMFVASPSREKLVYFGFETISGLYYYASAGVMIVFAFIFARILPRRHFASVKFALHYWVDRRGGLDYAAYFNELSKLEASPETHLPSEEHCHVDQLQRRAQRLSLKDLNEESLKLTWRQLAIAIHRSVLEMDREFAQHVVGKNEKIVFDTVMGAVLYWRLSDREVVFGVTIDQTSVDNGTAEAEFTNLGEGILELTGRRRY